MNHRREWAQGIHHSLVITDYEFDCTVPCMPILFPEGQFVFLESQIFLCLPEAIDLLESTTN